MGRDDATTALSLPSDEGGGPDLVHQVDMEAGQRGALFKVPLASTSPSGAVPGPSIPVQRKECDWTIIFQPVSLPYQWIAGGRKVGLQGNIIAVISWGAGSARFTKSIQLAHTTERRVTVHARYVDVAFYTAGSFTAGDSLTVQAAIVPGSFAGPDKYAWTMAQPPIDGAPSGMLWTGSGQNASAILGWLHAILQTAGPAGLVYLVGCDVAATTAVVSGTTPVIPGFVSDPLTGIGATDVLSDDQAPGAIGWTYGLFVGLSTTTGVYTAAGAGTVHVDLKAGQ